MSDETPAESPAEPEATGKPQYKRFRRPFNAVRLAPDAAARQGRAATMAWEKFRDSAAAAAFLNTHDETLGGRPIDLAVESASGLEAVERMLKT